MLWTITSYLLRILRYSIVLFLILFSGLAQAEEYFPLIVTPHVQDYAVDDFSYVYQVNNANYIGFFQISTFVGMKYTYRNQVIQGVNHTDHTEFTIDIKNHTIRYGRQKSDFNPADVRFFDDTPFFTFDFYRRFFKVTLSLNQLDMVLTVDGDEKFATTVQNDALKSRTQKGIYHFQSDPFSNYTFDNRLFTFPVVDLSLMKGVSKTQLGRSDESTHHTDSYAVNMAMGAFGLDTTAYISGSSGEQDRTPFVRLTAGRTFLDDPGNFLNLKKMELGDVSGYSNSYFTNQSYGRGATFSSFKNLVMSADKTITITGPLKTGWDVELYWNEQLVGYRQSEINGQYTFPDIPVSYGLNVFKLVFFGPYGEIETEYKRYYSGTSPVAQGQVGYTFGAFQPNRYLIENNRDNLPEDIAPVIDFVGYFGATDDLTLMGGLTTAPDAVNNQKSRHFSLIGAQYAFQGASFQYNLDTDTDSKKVGHHFEVQGDIYIGDIYAVYDYFGDLKSPTAYVNNTYLKNKLDTRLSGMLGGINLPYYVRYTTGKTLTDNQDYREVSTRLSKQVDAYWNVSVQNDYTRGLEQTTSQNDVILSLYHYYNKLSTNGQLAYRTHPDKEFSYFNIQSDYRLNRYTYVSAGWTHQVAGQSRDTLTLGAGRLFPFGGLNITAGCDSDRNASVMLTYHISLGKRPESLEPYTSAEAQLGSSGTIYAKAQDEHGIPIEGLGLFANGLEKEIKTDADGVAVLTNLSSYEKVVLTVDPETVPDVSMVPQFNEMKFVLRPGLPVPVMVPVKHMGAIEGRLVNDSPLMLGYHVAAVDAMGVVVTETFADTEGLFILDFVPFGTYDLVVSKEGQELKRLKNILLDDTILYLPNEIKVHYNPAADIQ